MVVDTTIAAKIGASVVRRQVDLPSSVSLVRRGAPDYGRRDVKTSFHRTISATVCSGSSKLAIIINDGSRRLNEDATTNDRLSVVVPDESKEQKSMMVSPASTSITDSAEQGEINSTISGALAIPRHLRSSPSVLIPEEQSTESEGTDGLCDCITERNMSSLTLCPEDSTNTDNFCLRQSAPNLAVAKKVMIGGDALKYLPTAYEPMNKKPEMFRRKRFVKLLCLFGLIFLGATAVVVTLVQVDSSHHDDANDTNNNEDSFALSRPNYIMTPREEEINGVLQRFVGEYWEEGSASALAAQWIIHDDSMQLESTSKNLKQRFLLAQLYYATGPWTQCVDYEQGKESYYCNTTRTLDHIYFHDRIRWLGPTSECDWFGVECRNDGSIHQLFAWDSELTGTIPSEIALLSRLDTISLKGNGLTGTIPTELYNMRELRGLELEDNHLTGTISEMLFQRARELQVLNLKGNFFTGTIPSEVINLSMLRALHTSENILTGTVPSTLFRLTTLRSMLHSSNLLTGSISNAIGNLTRLRILDIGSNRWTGAVPTEIGLLTEMRTFKLSYTTLGGSFPSKLYELTHLERLEIQDNQFTGTLDGVAMAKLSFLEVLAVENNLLTGTVPTELASLKNFESASFHYNDFVGSIPDGLCPMKMLTADCSDINLGQECSCCTSCCDREEHFCWLQHHNLHESRASE